MSLAFVTQNKNNCPPSVILQMGLYPWLVHLRNWSSLKNSLAVNQIESPFIPVNPLLHSQEEPCRKLTLQSLYSCSCPGSYFKVDCPLIVVISAQNFLSTWHCFQLAPNKMQMAKLAVSLTILWSM